MAGGIDGGVVQNARRRAGDNVDLADAVDLVPEELDPDRLVIRVGREDLHRVAADAEHVALKGDIVALIADLDELLEQRVKTPHLSRTEGDHHVGVVDRIAQTVDTGHRGDDDHIPPLKETGGRAVAQALDLIVDGTVLLDEGISVRDIGLRLVIVVVGDKVLDRVFGKELLELAAQLCGEGLVVRQHQRRAVEPCDHVCHRKGLAGAGHTEQHLLVDPVFDRLDQRVDRLGLVAHRLKS